MTSLIHNSSNCTSVLTDNSISFVREETLDVKKCLEELKHPSNIDELKTIISNLTLENPASDVLFKDKYLVLLLKDLIPWQEPLGKYFKTTYVICVAKSKKFSESENSNTDEVFSEDLGNPLSVKFESLTLQYSIKKSSSTSKHLNIKHDLYAVPQILCRKLLSFCTSFENSLQLPFLVVGQESKSKRFCFYGNSSVKKKPFHLNIINQGLITSMENVPSMIHLKQDHLSGFLPGSLVKSNVFVQYDFLHHDSTENSNLIPVKDARLSIKCSWSGGQSILEPLPSDCVCTVHLKSVVGDFETGSFSKFKELKLLKALQESLESGVMTWLTSNSSGLVMKNLKELINEVQNFTRKREISDYPNVDLNCIEEAIASERASSYFTDKLWLILKDCSSFNELLEAFHYVYEVLSDSTIQPPRTHGKDVSKFSKDLNDMAENRLVLPSLNPEKAAKLLLEIGIEKLRKDYEYLFTDLGLVPHVLFSHFIEPELSDPRAVTSLEKLHSVVEMMLVCIKWLKLPISVIREFARNALKHYTLSEIDLEHTFDFHIPTIYARPLLNQMRPTVWELSLLTSDKHFLKQSVHCFMTSATHDHIYAPQNYHPKLLVKGASYTYYYGTFVEETHN